MATPISIIARLITNFKGGIKSFADLRFAIADLNWVYEHAVRLANEYEESLRRVRGAIQATDYAAQKTTKSIFSMAEAMAETSTFTTTQMLEGLSILLTFPKVSGEQFDRATEAATDFAVATGRTLPDAMRALGKALNDPQRGMELLMEAGIFFDKQMRDHINTLDEFGKTAEAQNIILEAMEDRFEGIADIQLVDSMARLRVMNNALKTTFSDWATSFAAVYEGFLTAGGGYQSFLLFQKELRSEGEKSKLEWLAFGKAFAATWQWGASGIYSVLAGAERQLENFVGLFPTHSGESPTGRFFRDMKGTMAGKALESLKEIQTIQEEIYELEQEGTATALQKAAEKQKELEAAKELLKLEEERADIINKFDRLTQTAEEKREERWQELMKAREDMTEEQFDRAQHWISKKYQQESGIEDRMAEQRRQRERERKKAVDELFDHIAEKNKEREEAEEELIRGQERASRLVKEIWDRNNPFSAYLDDARELRDALSRGEITKARATRAIGELRRQQAEDMENMRERDPGFTPSVISGGAAYYASIARQVGTIESEQERLQKERIEQAETHNDQTQESLGKIEKAVKRMPAMAG